MATAPQAFRGAIKARKDEVIVASFNIESYELDEAGDVIYDEENEPVTITEQYDFTRPSESALFFLFGAAADDDGSGEVGAIFGMLREALSDEQFRSLRRRLKSSTDSLDMEDFGTFMEEALMPAWMDFPTQQPAGSSASRANTGARSTGRARGKGSTR